MDVLYHASTQKNLDIIQPQRTLSHDTYIGDFVFATSNRAYAAMYLAPQGRPMLLHVFDGKPYLVVNDTSELFLQADKGGAIYEVPADSFTDTPQVELAETERVSPVPVVPLGKQVYDTSLQALKQMGVPLYFVDATTFDKIRHAEDHGWMLLQTLDPYQAA